MSEDELLTEGYQPKKKRHVSSIPPSGGSSVIVPPRIGGREMSDYDQEIIAQLRAENARLQAELEGLTAEIERRHAALATELDRLRVGDQCLVSEAVAASTKELRAALATIAGIRDNNPAHALRRCQDCARRAIGIADEIERRGAW